MNKPDFDAEAQSVVDLAVKANTSQWETKMLIRGALKNAYELGRIHAADEVLEALRQEAGESCEQPMSTPVDAGVASNPNTLFGFPIVVNPDLPEPVIAFWRRD